MTPDLEKLRRAKKLESIFEDLEFELVDEPDWDEPSDVSYLSAKEKKDPDIASNVEAMAATNKLISWFGRGQMGFAGLWRGPKNHKLDKAPIVVLDTEGHYEIAATTIADFIAISVDEDSFADVKQALTGAGFKVAKSQEAIWETLEAFEDDDPNEYRNELYNDGRVKRGLERVD